MKILKGSPQYLELTAGLSANQPLYLTMNLETRCCYRCPKCALNDEGRGLSVYFPLSVNARKRILSLARKAGVKSLVIIGMGEPTDKQSFEIVHPIIQHANDLGLMTILFTTLYGLTKQQAEFFKNHNVSLYISLDSLNPKTYRFLTGNGRLENILRRIKMLRKLYLRKVMSGHTIVGLGINTTVVRQNIGELEKIRQFAGDDIHFVANTPMHRGHLNQSGSWQTLVGNDYGLLARRAVETSETGGHSSINEGVCSYLFRGVSVDTDGQMLWCGYASETAGTLAHASSLRSAGDFLKHFRLAQTWFSRFSEIAGHRPSCPLRNEHYPRFVSQSGNPLFNILG